jgi:hypothetical protein
MNFQIRVILAPKANCAARHRILHCSHETIFLMAKPGGTGREGVAVCQAASLDPLG